MGSGARAGPGVVAAVFALAALVPVSAGAQHVSRADTPVQRLERAADLVDWARAEGDPLALVVAARMSRGVALDDPLAPETLWAEARLLARGDTAVLALIEREAADQDRGVCSGPTRSEGRLAPGQSRTIRLAVAGHEIADAALRLPAHAPAGSDLDLIVTDTGGRGVTSSTGPSTGVPGTAAYVQWTPSAPAEVQVTVANVGGQTNDYRLTLAPAQGGPCR